ncbi:hypothetical protein [Planktotalea sp.]|uniref:hypothetical protein n=1 Tax=Planktotalea sp. TaxID=2029877 RepID=UPI003D6B2885
MKHLFSSVLVAAFSLTLPNIADAKEFKYNWKRTISSGAFDQETFFHWTKMGADGICRQDTSFTIDAKKKPKKGTVQWFWVSKVLPSGECAGNLVSGYQIVYTPKRKPKKDEVVLMVRGLDRLDEGRVDVDKARIEIKIRKR